MIGHSVQYVDFPFQAFANFKIPAVAAFTASDVDRLLGDSGIVRHRGKIEAAIANARGLQELHKSGVTLASLFEVCDMPIIFSALTHTRTHTRTAHTDIHLDTQTHPPYGNRLVTTL